MKDTLKFDEKDRYVNLVVLNGDHRLARSDLVGIWNDECVVMKVKMGKNVMDVKVVTLIQNS